VTNASEIDDRGGSNRGRRDPRSDADLVDAIARRERSAFDELYARHEPWLSRRLAFRCSDRSAVDEAVQDTFVAVWSCAEGYGGSGPVAAWIWGIGRRRLLHTLRRRKSVFERLAVQPLPVQCSAEDELMLGPEHSEIGSALGHLSPALRIVVQVTVVDGFSCQEAGRVIGIPPGTVKTRMMRAKREIRSALVPSGRR
jgi:RNA polymerase sigma-70 factor (ECF subfamily)